jgi:hypothetical protein
MNWKTALGEKLYFKLKKYCIDNKMSIAQFVRLAAKKMLEE